MTRREFKYAVLGLGGLGSGATYWLSRRCGSDVVAFEQYVLGHPHGESQDHSRIIRLSYHTSLYVELAKQAYTAWQTVESDLQQPLIVKTGGLDLWPPNAAIPMSDYTSSLQQSGVSFELIDGAEIRKRFLPWKIGDDVAGMYQNDAGIAPAARCNAAHQELARRNGATLIENGAVNSITTSADSYTLETSCGSFSCQKLIIANGPWTNRTLEHFKLRLPLIVTQEQVTYFETPELSAFSPDRFPIWIWMDEPSFYGFPVYGERGVKVGQDVGGKEVSVDTRTYDVDADAYDRVRTFMQRYLPDALGPVIYSKSCLYTLTPDRDFIIDRLPEHPNCYVTVGAGHAFKFASIIGKILSELAIDGTTNSNIEPFRFTRPILREQNPQTHFLF